MGTEFEEAIPALFFDKPEHRLHAVQPRTRYTHALLIVQLGRVVPVKPVACVGTDAQGYPMENRLRRLLVQPAIDEMSGTRLVERDLPSVWKAFNKHTTLPLCTRYISYSKPHPGPSALCPHLQSWLQAVLHSVRFYVHDVLATAVPECLTEARDLLCEVTALLAACPRPQSLIEVMRHLVACRVDVLVDFGTSMTCMGTLAKSKPRDTELQTRCVEALQCAIQQGTVPETLAAVSAWRKVVRFWVYLPFCWVNRTDTGRELQQHCAWQQAQVCQGFLTAVNDMVAENGFVDPAHHDLLYCLLKFATDSYMCRFEPHTVEALSPTCFRALQDHAQSVMGRLECLFQMYIGLAGATPPGVPVLPAKTCKAALKVIQCLIKSRFAKQKSTCTSGPHSFLAALLDAGPDILHQHPEYGYFDATALQNVDRPLLAWLRHGLVPFLITCPVKLIPYSAYYILHIYEVLRDQKLPASVVNTASCLPMIILQCLALHKTRYLHKTHYLRYKWWHPLVHGAKDTRNLFASASAAEDPFPASRVLDATVSVLQCRSRFRIPRDSICGDFVSGVVQAIWDFSPHGRWLCEQPGCCVLGMAQNTVGTPSLRWSCNREAWVTAVCRAFRRDQ
jgi:hypothetical protein